MIDIDVKGLHETQVAVGQFARVLKQGYAAFFSGVFSGQMTKYFAQRFDSEGAAHGTRWAPLKERTLARSRTLRHGGILYRFGKLRQSFLSPAAPGSLEAVKPFEYLRGSRDKPAIFHQEGTRKMVRREIINVPPGLATFWLSLLNTYHLDELKKAGLA